MASNHALSYHARQNHGVLSLDEVRALGLSRSEVATRVGNGTLEKIYPGVFLIAGSPVTRFTRWRAAVLHGGPGSMLYGRSAGKALQLDGIEEGPLPEVAVRTGSSRTGLKIHRLQPEDLPRTIRVEGIPLTNVDRTLIDLAGTVPPRKVGLAIDDALRRRLTALPRLWAELERTGGQGRRGTGNLRRLLEARDLSDSALRSAFEARMKRILARIDIEKAIPNYRIELEGKTFYIDFYYPLHRLAIECHSFRWHVGYDGLKDDVQRDRVLKRAGILPLYITWDETYFEADRVEQEVSQALGQREVFLRLQL